MRVLIADDHNIVREGIKAVILSNNISVEFDDVDNGRELFELVKQNSYDLVILDINMPGVNGLVFLQNILVILPSLKILVFSRYSEELFGIPFLKAGAYGYLSKNSDASTLKKAITTIINGRRYISESIQQKIEDAHFNNSNTSNVFESLSSREIEIMLLLFEGFNNKQIEKILNLASTSVSTYRHRIFSKLGTENLIEIKALYDLLYTIR